MAYTAVSRVPNHNHNLRELNDVNNAAIGNGKTLVWDAVTGKHVYQAGGSGNLDADSIVTSQVNVIGINMFLVVTDDNGNVVSVDV